MASTAMGDMGRRALRATAVFSLLGGLITLGLMPCPTALILRVPCPGCGMTRATMALLHGNLHESFRFHPLGLLILPVLVTVFGVNTLVYVRTGRWGFVERQMGRSVTVVAGAFLFIVFAVWFSRFFGAFGGPVPV